DLASNQNLKCRCRIASITSSSPRAEPPGNRWKKVSTASAALSNLITASQPSKLPFSGSADHLPSLTVARHFPPHAPRTSIPYVNSLPFDVFSSTVYCQKDRKSTRLNSSH